MYFQSIDDKHTCVGVYKDGRLFFEKMPSDLLRTWKYAGSHDNENIEYGWLYCDGKSLEQACPEDLKSDFKRLHKKLHAFRKSFELAKINFREHCFFDLVPHDFLTEFLDVKTQITQHVFENYEKPAHYEHLKKTEKLLYKIKYQNLNINNKDCKSLFLSSGLRSSAQKALKCAPYIDYNLFGTVTGRLTTRSDSFPVLTLKKELRKLMKPNNDWFLSLDYNGAEIRTFLALSGEQQPSEDVHEWNMQNVFKKEEIYREEAKTMFFAWLYNPDSKAINSNFYDREKLFDTHYKDGRINTVFGRQIKTSDRKAVNYLIQSTTADLVIDRAIEIDRFLRGKKSYISHIVHDEVVIDLDDSERNLVPDIKRIFSENKLDKFMVNLNIGKNYFDLERLNL